MPVAAPTCPAENPSPVAGSVSASAMLLAIDTSRPSRTQVTPKANITSVCHRLQGNRSILAGTCVSTGLVSLTPRLLFLLPRILPKEPFAALLWLCTPPNTALVASILQPALVAATTFDGSSNMPTNLSFISYAFLGGFCLQPLERPSYSSGRTTLASRGGSEPFGWPLAGVHRV